MLSGNPETKPTPFSDLQVKEPYLKKFKDYVLMDKCGGKGRERAHEGGKHKSQNWGLGALRAQVPGEKG